jgi:hypothetical protein
VKHYCTYFDSKYLPLGMALAASLQRHDPGATLWVLALDEDAAAHLGRLNWANVRVVAEAGLLRADPELANVAGSRSRREFIFTLTACWVRWLLQTHPEIAQVAYVDSDLYFFSDPAPAWAELGEASVLIVPHRFPPWHDDSRLYGRFNVGWLVFRNDAAALACLDWWRKCCLESCALEADGVRYGDQKYLDDWPQRFGPAVTIGGHPGVNLAPWNWAGHRFELGTAGVRVDGAPLVVFHFAQFRRIAGAWWDSGQLEYGVMPLGLRSRIYGPYAAALDAAERELDRVAPRFRPPSSGWRAALGPWHLALLRLFWGQFWLRCGSWMVAGRLGWGRFSGRAMAIHRRRQRSKA